VGAAGLWMVAENDVFPVEILAANVLDLEADGSLKSIIKTY
jgi:hypothetical protein